MEVNLDEIFIQPSYEVGLYSFTEIPLSIDLADRMTLTSVNIAARMPSAKTVKKRENHLERFKSSLFAPKRIITLDGSEAAIQKSESYVYQRVYEPVIVPLHDLPCTISSTMPSSFMQVSRASAKQPPAKQPLCLLGPMGSGMQRRGSGMTLSSQMRLALVMDDRVTPQRHGGAKRDTTYYHQMVGKPPLQRYPPKSARPHLTALMKAPSSQGADSIIECKQTPPRRHAGSWQETDKGTDAPARPKGRGIPVCRKGEKQSHALQVLNGFDFDVPAHHYGRKRMHEGGPAPSMKRARPPGKKSDPGSVVMDDEEETAPPRRSGRPKSQLCGGYTLVPLQVEDLCFATPPCEGRNVTSNSHPNSQHRVENSGEKFEDDSGVECVGSGSKEVSAGKAKSQSRAKQKGASCPVRRSLRIRRHMNDTEEVTSSVEAAAEEILKGYGDASLSHSAPRVPPGSPETLESSEDEKEKKAVPFARRGKRKISVTVAPEDARSTARAFLPPPQSGIKGPILHRGAPRNLIQISDGEDGSSKDSIEELEEDFSRKAEISASRFYAKGSDPDTCVPEKRRSTRRRSNRITNSDDDSDSDAVCTVAVKKSSPRRPFTRSRDMIPETSGDIRLVLPNMDELNKIHQMTAGFNKNHVVTKIKEANIELTVEHFDTLRGSRWLSDEVMNCFVALLNSRNLQYCSGLQEDKESVEKDVELVATVEKDSVDDVPKGMAAQEKLFTYGRPRVHVFNTFFYARLSQNGYDYHGVRRWLKRAGRDINKLNMIMFPINISNLHWVLAAVDIRGRQLIYFDSMNGRDSLGALENLRQWYFDEVADKCGKDAAEALNIESWATSINPNYLPRQHDGGSCGIFTLYMAEYLEWGMRPTFKQRHIPALRKRTAMFLMEGVLPTSCPLPPT